MAGSITVTTSAIGRPDGNITKYSIAWVSDASGDVSGNTFDVTDGEIVQVRFIPSATAAPTAAYDVVVNDANSVDAVTALGANLSATDTSVAVPAVSTYFRRFVESGTLTPVVSNAGNAKEGTIELLVK